MYILYNFDPQFAYERLKKWRILKSTMVLITNGVSPARRNPLPNGEVDDYFVTIRPEVALILPVTSNQEIILVRQYRHGAGEILLELPPAGTTRMKRAHKQQPYENSKKRLGILLTQLFIWHTLYDNPVKDTNKINLFIAENVTKLDNKN